MIRWYSSENSELTDVADVAVEDDAEVVSPRGPIVLAVATDALGLLMSGIGLSVSGTVCKSSIISILDSTFLEDERFSTM